jgi:EpsI family protein
MVSTDSLDSDVEGVLKADDYLLRRYRDSNGQVVDFFIAYYRAQQAGESMHSPKNCLPGAGWVPIINDTAVLTKSVNGGNVKVNRYVIEKDGDRALAIYWYQENGRVIANEYAGKFYLIWDSLKTGRRDGAIVRVFVPVNRSKNPEQALNTALDFARTIQPQLPAFLPN